MFRRSGGAGANAHAQVVVDYFGDPDNDARTAGLYRDIWTRAEGYLQHVFIGDQSDPSRSFNGWHKPLQQFTGTGGRNSVLFGNEMALDLSHQPAGAGGMELDDPTQRIFANRLRRRYPA